MERRLILADYTEIIGKLISVNTDSVILNVGGQPVKVFLAIEQIPRQKLRRFLGHKLGILRMGNQCYFRMIRASRVEIGISEGNYDE